MFTLGSRSSRGPTPRPSPTATRSATTCGRPRGSTASRRRSGSSTALVNAEWSSKTGRWTVHAHRDDTDEQVQLTCSFLYTCAGYYRYDKGYSPSSPASRSSPARSCTPQALAADLDYAGKKVVVIGSGATAVTLVPAMRAGRPRHHAAALAHLHRVDAVEGRTGRHARAKLRPRSPTRSSAGRTCCSRC